MLCMLLRLCHCMYLHPVVCMIGGWAHLPLLTLASRIFGGEDVLMFSKVTPELMERELFGNAPNVANTSNANASGVFMRHQSHAQKRGGPEVAPRTSKTE